MVKCKHCGSTNVIKNGTRVASNSIIKQRLICKDCGHGDIVNITPGLICLDDSLYSRMSPFEVGKVWLSRPENGSAQIVLPKALANKHGLYGNTRVIIEDTANGLLIRKLEVNA